MFIMKQADMDDAWIAEERIKFQSLRMTAAEELKMTVAQEIARQLRGAYGQAGVNFKSIRLNEVLVAVCEEFDVTPSLMLANRRTADVITARQVAYYIAREITPFSFPCIADFFQRDHTTVMHGAKKIEELVARPGNDLAGRVGKLIYILRRPDRDDPQESDSLPPYTG